MGAYMVRPKDTQFDEQTTQQFLMKRLQPKSSPCNENWKNSCKKDVGKFKKAASTFKGSVDSLLSKFKNSENQMKDLSTFIYTSVGLVIEVILSEEHLSERKNKRNKNERQVRTTSNSPYNGHKDENAGGSMESLQNRLHQLIIQSNNNYYNQNSIYSNNTYSFNNNYDNIYNNNKNYTNYSTPNYNSNSNLETLNSSNECVEITNSYKIKKYSLSNTQIPSDFSKNCPDKTFSYPLQGLSISQGQFKAFLPLSSFPRGHICLKVRGYRLEILHLIKSISTSKSANSLKKKSNTLSVRKDSTKNNIKVEPICLNSCLNDFSFSNQTNKFYNHLNRSNLYSSIHRNYQNIVVPKLDTSLYNHEKPRVSYKSRSTQDSDNNYYNHKNANKNKNDQNNDINNNYFTKNCNNFNNPYNNHSFHIDSSLNHSSQKNYTYTTYNTSNTNYNSKTYNNSSPNSNYTNNPNNTYNLNYTTNTSKLPSPTHNENHVSTEEDKLLAYCYLGNVSVPIYVEPSSLELDVDEKCQWMVLRGKMKQCISSNCLNLEDDEDHVPTLK